MKYTRFETKLSHRAQKIGIPLLRYTIAIIYLWYGLLKVLGISPVAIIVTKATSWIGVPYPVVILGVFEIILGLCLLIKPLIRLGILLLFLQIFATFLSLFFAPEHYFTIFPYGLTIEGQYLFKNLVTLAVALILLGSLHPTKK